MKLHDRARALSLLLASTTLACGGAPPPPPASTAAAASRWPAPYVASDEPWSTQGFYASGRFVRVADEDGATLALSSGARIRATDAALVWADQALPQELLAAAHIDGQWLFVESMGTIFRAEGDFLGTLAITATAPDVVSEAWAAPSIVLMHHPSSWSVLDSSGVHPLEVRDESGVVPQAGILGAALASDGSMAAVVVPGSLFVAPPGQPFARVALPSPALRVRRSADGGFACFTLAGWQSVRAGVVTASAGDADAADVTPEADRALQRRISEDNARRQSLDSNVPVSASGRAVRYMGEDHELYVWDGAANAVVRIEAPDEDCSWAGFGDAVLALCGRNPTRLFVSDDLHTLTHVGDISLDDPERGLVFSTDGSSFGGLGTCVTPSAGGEASNKDGDEDDDDDGDASEDEESDEEREAEEEAEAEAEAEEMNAALGEGDDASAYEEPPQSFCWHDGTQLRQHTIPSEVAVLALYRNLAVVGSSYGGDTLMRVDLTSDAPPVPYTLSGRARGWRVTADGWLTGAAEDGTAYWTGAVDGTLASHAFPEGATSIQFADRLHGLAIGAQFDDPIRTTHDGGATWTPVTPSWAGDPAPYATNDWFRCGPGGCALTAVLGYAPERLIAPSRDHRTLLWPPYRTAGRDEASLEPESRAGWTCTPTRTRATPRAPTGASIAWTWDESYEQGQPVPVHVRGADARGAFRLDTQIPSDDGGLAIFFASRGLAVASTGEGRGPTGLSVIAGGRPATRIALPVAEHVSFGDLGGLAMPNGGALIFAGGLYDIDEHIDVLFTLDANGAEQSRETLVSATHGDRWPAMLASGETGIAIRLGDTYYLVRTSGRTRLGTHPAAIAICNGAPTARLAIGVNGPWAELRGGHGSIESMVIGFVHDEACVDAIAMGPDYHGDGGILALADHGQLRAASLTRDGTATAMRCAPTPDEDEEEDEDEEDEENADE